MELFLTPLEGRTNGNIIRPKEGITHKYYVDREVCNSCEQSHNWQVHRSEAFLKYTLMRISPFSRFTHIDPKIFESYLKIRISQLSPTVYAYSANCDLFNES